MFPTFTRCPINDDSKTIPRKIALPWRTNLLKARARKKINLDKINEVIKRSTIYIHRYHRVCV